MFNPLPILKTGLGAAVSFLGGIKTTLIASAITGALAFGGGWYLCQTHDAKIQATALVAAADKARKAQSDKDSADWSAAKADYEARLHIAEGANQVLADLLAKKPKTVTRPGQCPVIAPESMRSLNDPKLVGDTQ